MVNLSDIIIPNTDFKSWVKWFGADTKRDYGIEYLILATDGQITGISDIERYVLSAHLYNELIKESTLDKIGKQALASLLWNWNRGQKPWSINGLDKLRQNPSSPYYIDLLKPQSYDGTYLNIDGIPLSHLFLNSFSYLTASILCGGSITLENKPNAMIIPPNKRNVSDFAEKIRGCVVRKIRGHRSALNLKRPYAYLLLLTGNREGSLTNAMPEQLEIPYLTQLILYVKKDVLSPSDRSHAVSVIRGFVEGVIDHKQTFTNYGSRVVKLPLFTNIDTAMAFLKMYQEAFDLSFPNVQYSLNSAPKVTKMGNKVYYISIMTLIKNQSRAPAIN